jgi:N6-adenosine-specific RNA methylase IME4
MPYDILYVDPPWHYPSLTGVTRLADGSYRQGAPGGARRHYPTMTDDRLLRLPVRSLASDAAALFLWATCPRLDFALDVIREWGFHYRGVAYVWVKTKMDGTPMGAKGPPPAFVKPTSELLLVATTIKRGRVFPLLDYAQRQVVLTPRGRHSAKPNVFRENILALCGDRPRVELFARESVPGWDVWGQEVTPSGDLASFGSHRIPDPPGVAKP